jgi:RimJ/RimL family protein N-acetyltransferase
MYRGSLVNIRHQSINDMSKLAEFMCTPRYLETHGYDDPRFAYKEGLEKKFKERMEKHDHNELHMVIETVDNKVIGAIGIDGNFWKNGLTWMYSYIGDVEYLEGGYYEEAIALMLEFLFAEGNARKIKVNIQSNDQYGLSAYMSNGFTTEVVFMEDVLCHGKYIDTYDMCIFKDEYMKTYKLQKVGQ